MNLSKVSRNKRRLVVALLGLVFESSIYAQIFTTEEKKKAEQGDSVAQYFLYFSYSSGSGIKADHEEALKWLIKSAEGGFPKAEMVLGTIYARGQGLPKNKEKAFKWYKKAADKGLAEAQFLVGNCFIYGDGVNECENEAIRYYKMSAEQKYEPSVESLKVLANDPDSTNLDASKISLGELGKERKWIEQYYGQGNEVRGAITTTQYSKNEILILIVFSNEIAKSCMYIKINEKISPSKPESWNEAEIKKLQQANSNGQKWVFSGMGVKQNDKIWYTKDKKIISLLNNNGKGLLIQYTKDK